MRGRWKGSEREMKIEMKIDIAVVRDIGVKR